LHEWRRRGWHVEVTRGVEGARGVARRARPSGEVEELRVVAPSSYEAVSRLFARVHVGETDTRQPLAH
jgi:hypothetical protein